MNKKEPRKRIELQILLATEEILSREHPAAYKAMRKSIKTHSKQLAKKFLKMVGKEDKKNSSKQKPAAVPAARKPAVKKTASKKPVARKK